MIFQKCVSYFTLVVFVMVSTLVVSQTTVNIPCTGPVNPNSGRIYDASTKSYGYLYSGVSQENRGWARFEIQNYIPSCATITSAEVIFWVETSSGFADNNH